MRLWLHLHETDVDVLAAARLQATHRDDVLAGLECGFARRIEWQLFVVAGESDGGRGEHAVNVNLRVFVVVNEEREIFPVASGDFEFATQPDVRRVPFRAHDCAGSVARAESAGARLPR